MQGKVIKLDVMNYIYHEMWSANMEQKLPPYAPYIEILIESTWEATKGTALTSTVPVSFIDQEKKKLMIKTHKQPVESPEKDAAPSWAKSLANFMKKALCRNLD